MAPREATNTFPDHYILDYDATAGPILMAHDGGDGINTVNDGGEIDNENVDMDEPPETATSMSNEEEDSESMAQEEGAGTTANPTNELQLPNSTMETNGMEDEFNTGENIGTATRRPRRRHENGGVGINGFQENQTFGRPNHVSSVTSLSTESHVDVDPLSIDMTDPEEEDAWTAASAMLVDSLIATTSNVNCIIRTNNSPPTPPTVHSIPPTPRNSANPILRRRSSAGNPPHGNWVNSSPGEGRSITTPFTSSPSPASSSHLRQFFRHRRSLSSVLDQDPSLDSEDEPDSTNESMPDLDTTQDNSTSTIQENSMFSTAPNTPQTNSSLPYTDQNSLSDSYPYPTAAVVGSSSSATADATNVTQPSVTVTLSPVRRSGGSRSRQPVVVIADEDASSSSSISGAGSTSPLQVQTSLNQFPILPSPPSPHRIRSSTTSSASFASIASGSNRSIHWTPAFETTQLDEASTSESNGNSASSNRSGNHINLSFGPNTSVTDLKYFAERGCIVPLLRALKTARLKTLGTRMLADYAKMPHRRVAVASNKRILEFCCRTMLEVPSAENMGTEWPAREYAVETIRSLTATEDSDSYLMGCVGLLKALAIVARGGPFIAPSDTSLSSAMDTLQTTFSPHPVQCTPSRGTERYNSTSSGASVTSSSSSSYYSAIGFNFTTTVNKGLVSGKARLHACIAIMNLSCGKANKIEIASVSEILEAMRDVMMAPAEHFAPATSSPAHPNGSSSHTTPSSVGEEARLKAATCVKNLSNADANDASLLGSAGLIEALGLVAANTCSVGKGATNCTTNACLALMNLSISKANKHRVFMTKGVMDALMTVIVRTLPSSGNETWSNANIEARVKACSALSNLAIGYENKIPMFAYPGFVDAILKVIGTDSGEARTKACSILWSFAAEMKNQVPVVQRGDILPTLVRVAEEDHSTEARFKCVAALTLLAESLDNALPLLESGALHPLMDILHDAGADPTQWKGQTASWCVGFLMNMAQSDDAVPFLREAGVVELLAPLLTLDHYQSLKAAMAVTFVCRYDEDDETYDLLRKTENVIPKIISLLHNTLAGRGGNGYKYGVFTLRSSVGCISSLASGPEFMKERIATGPVFESLLRVVTDFCVNGGTKGAIVGGGRDDSLSATLAIRALHSLTEYLIPIPGSSTLSFGANMDKKLMTAVESFESCNHPDIKDQTRILAADAHKRIHCSQALVSSSKASHDCGSIDGGSSKKSVRSNIIENSIVQSLVQGCCIGPSLHIGDEDGIQYSRRSPSQQTSGPTQTIDTYDGDESITSCSSKSFEGQTQVRTFLLKDSRTGRRFAVPSEPTGGRPFNDRRRWCYLRGRFCRGGEVPDPNFRWTDELQNAYETAVVTQRSSSASPVSMASSAGVVTPTDQRNSLSPNSNQDYPSISPANSSGAKVDGSNC